MIISKNKAISASIALLVIGSAVGYLIIYLAGGLSNSASNMDMSKMEAKSSEPLYYRNPMNPEVTSPTPAQDNMGMDYIPVYADEPKGESSEPKILFYRNPMNPDITSPAPAQDDMGMDYIPVYDEGSNPNEVVGTVKIDSTIVQNIGVRTTTAKLGSLSRTIRALGKVDYNEEGMTRIHSKTEGWIDELFIDRTGEAVKVDTMLLSIYSPKLVSTQEEYLLAMDNYKSLKKNKFSDIKKGAKDLLENTKERLEFLDVPDHQIRELEQSRKIKKNLHIHSPSAGTVMNIGARKGQHVTPGTELYMIADLSKVWVYADIYEYEIPWVKAGDEAEMTLKGIPGRIFKGTLDYVYPYAETKTRTIKVRLVFDNPNLLLRPEMFVKVNIKAQKQDNVITIPTEAVVKSGVMNQVFIVRGKGKFEPREVTLGIESDGKVVILKGIKEGEEVVTSSQFLIDSESKLKEATAKMMESMSEKDEANKKDEPMKDEEWDD